MRVTRIVDQLIDSSVDQEAKMPTGSTVPGTSVPLSQVKAELFKALAHPARIRALEVLAEGARSVGELQPLVGIESSHLSQQLGVLRRAGLVTTRKDGSSVFYAVRDPLVVELLSVAKRLLLTTLTETRVLLEDLAATAGER
jgi:DNA-binding transcriptional ArsR family regulator